MSASLAVGHRPVRNRRGRSASTATGPISVELRRDLDLRAGRCSGPRPPDRGPARSGVFLSQPVAVGLLRRPAGRASSPRWSCCGRAGSSVESCRSRSARRPRTPRCRLLGGALGPIASIWLPARGFEAAASDAFVCSGCATTFGARDSSSSSATCRRLARCGGRYIAPRRRTTSRALQPREISHAAVPGSEGTTVAAAPDARRRPPAPRSLDKHRRWLERRCRLRIERPRGSGRGPRRVRFSRRDSSTRAGAARGKGRRSTIRERAASTQRALPLLLPGRLPSDGPAVGRRGQDDRGLLRHGQRPVVGLLPVRIRP